jgi:uncharacterized membrane protein (UPF0127 family)
MGGSDVAPTTSREPEQAGESPFERNWARIDYPVATDEVERTWLWGPAALTEDLAEVYVDAPIGRRRVLYYDKARMEITDPNADPSESWFVTNGLLVVEMITGELHVGDDATLSRNPSAIAVAGDVGQVSAPSYASLAGLLDAEPHPGGGEIIARIDGSGVVSDDHELGQYGVVAVELITETNHRVAAPFWSFLQSTGAIWTGSGYAEDMLFPDPFYATGLPITEAYWAAVEVGGQPRDVLLQCFERRCLTFTPDNPESWRVESGNVGRHYYEWRYGLAEAPEPVPYPAALDALPAVIVQSGAGEGAALLVEVVDDFAGRQCGLMHRRAMPENQAMLFVFQSDGTGGFWNCNTFIALTLAWIDSDGLIVDLTDMQPATPGQPQSPETYLPSGSYRYVIEANQGWFAGLGVRTGDRLDLSAALTTGATSDTTICDQLGLQCQ